MANWRKGAYWKSRNFWGRADKRFDTRRRPYTKLGVFGHAQLVSKFAISSPSSSDV